MLGIGEPLTVSRLFLPVLNGSFLKVTRLQPNRSSLLNAEAGRAGAGRLGRAALLRPGAFSALRPALQGAWRIGADSARSSLSHFGHVGLYCFLTWDLHFASFIIDVSVGSLVPLDRVTPKEAVSGFHTSCPGRETVRLSNVSGAFLGRRVRL